MSLEGSLNSNVEDDRVTFRFTVKNDGAEAVEMQFSDSQTFDVVVEDDGEEVWRYGEGMMFAQMIQNEDLFPGESLGYEAEWDDPEAGDFEATATLEATDADCEATTTFSV